MHAALAADIPASGAAIYISPLCLNLLEAENDGAMFWGSKDLFDERYRLRRWPSKVKREALSTPSRFGHLLDRARNISLSQSFVFLFSKICLPRKGGWAIVGPSVFNLVVLGPLRAKQGSVPLVHEFEATREDRREKLVCIPISLGIHL